MTLEISSFRQHHSSVDPYLRLSKIQKTFGRFVALKDINLEVKTGEFICLLGPSGCGKTTLLRILAGLDYPDAGQIWQGGREITLLPPAQRDFGIVFQSYALFPNLTASQNISYGLENTGMSKANRQARVEELLALVGLTGSGSKYPAQLSGGQQQRIALARALALSPSLLLLDEPLSALDAQVRSNLRFEITQLQKRLNVTTVMVTHDQLEALTMADRVVLMEKGNIAQVGSPSDIYHHPQTPFVARFIGSMNFLPGIVTDQNYVDCGRSRFRVDPLDIGVGNKVWLAIRPEEVQIRTDQDFTENGLENHMEVQVKSTEFLGSLLRVWLEPPQDQSVALMVELSAQQARESQLQSNSRIRIQFPSHRIKVFPV
jgi:iron(III) transport system ATP-binding protein